MDATDEPLWRALQPLRSVACWLMTGAHPDDEWSGFLAWLAFGRGVHTVYACATRGEGGQNALGPERGQTLAALRSREMERAAAELELAVRWLGGDETFPDFGFSKSAEDTLRRWGEARLLNCLVRLIRTERPDALSPTFLDVPGQHGHHRAITRSTLQAAELAADPNFLVPESALPAWRVAKIYLPAFSGAGASYDDREPPPPETVRVDLGATCPALAETWARLGERSRRCHASQGMGRDLADGPCPFPLHLVAGVPDVAAPMDGVAHSVSELVGTFSIRLAAREVDVAIADALAGFPNRRKIAHALHRALAQLKRIMLPAGADDIARRLHLKRRQLGRAAALALGIDADVIVTPEQLLAGGKATVSMTVRGPATAKLRVPGNWRVATTATGQHEVTIPMDETPFSTLKESFDPLGGDDVIGATLTWTHHGSAGELERNPHQRLSLAPQHEPKTVPPRLPRVLIDPEARVGVIAGDTDETLGWLQRFEIAAEAVADATLTSGDLDRFTTLVVGVFGFGQRPALRTHRDRLIAWIEAGGSLVTMYHRPGDGWDDGRTPPRRLVIGSPSFRWRVTDPAAPVRVLVPEHPLLNKPNIIGPADWDGWVRERGLYFASEWDPAYQALIELSDPGEPPLRGALLSATVGAGRHVHVALALHHQFSALVPGAFRLLGNLVARPG